MHRTRRSLLAAAATSLSGLAGCTSAGDAPETTATLDGQASELSLTGGNTDENPDMLLTAIDFETRTTECGSGQNDADVSFDDDDGQVTVSGVIGGSDGCEVAVLRNVAVADDAVEVIVGTRDGRTNDSGSPESCATCITDIGYEGTFRFDGGFPSEATIYHESQTWESDEPVAQTER